MARCLDVEKGLIRRRSNIGLALRRVWGCTTGFFQAARSKSEQFMVSIVIIRSPRGREERGMQRTKSAIDRRFGLPIDRTHPRIGVGGDDMAICNDCRLSLIGKMRLSRIEIGHLNRDFF